MEFASKLITNINKLNINDIFKEIWSNSSTQRYIERLQTQGEPTSQLISGINSDGSQITPEYSPTTKMIKVEKGQPIDRVTLKDTGEFYESHNIVVLDDGFKIDADYVKDQDDLRDKYGDEITGLTEENTEILLKKIETEFNEKLEKKLFQ